MAGRAVLCHWSTHTQRARAAARRSICCTARTLSTSPWKRGTLARSPACGCAAAHARPLGPLPPEPTTRRARAVAPRRLCSLARALSISPWKRGTLARSPACWCAAARAGSRRGVAFRHRNMQTFDANSACACGGAAQGMFYNAITFNQPVAAWDVGKVTAMRVRRRPRREPERLGWRFFATGALNRPARAVWRGAGRVQLRERFQPARGSVGRWPGHQNGCAPPPAAP